MAEIKIIGVDPSLNNFGFAVAMYDLEKATYRITDLKLAETGNEAGKQVRKNSDDIRRARILFDGLKEMCEGAAFAIAEVPVGSQSARAMASYGMCCGVLAACPIPLVQVNPTEVKLAAIGDKYAAKEEMIQWGLKEHPDAPWLSLGKGEKKRYLNKNEHLADACAAIKAGLKTEQVRGMLNLFAMARKAA